MTLAILAMAILCSMAESGPGHGHHGKHGNPEDLDNYVSKMEAPDRDVWQKPAEVLRALGVKAGQVVCDIGAGPGYFALRLSPEVGARGAVFVIRESFRWDRHSSIKFRARSFFPSRSLPVWCSRRSTGFCPISTSWSFVVKLQP